jgi:hypothetical protein
LPANRRSGARDGAGADRRGEGGPPQPSGPSFVDSVGTPLAVGGETAAVVPALTAYIDLSEWDARAKSPGGTSNSLFAGFASRLGVRAGRIRDDGAVTLSFPVSERTENDSRGNALTSAVVTVDSTHVMSYLSGIRIKIKQALVGLAEKPNELLILGDIRSASSLRGWPVVFGAEINLVCPFRDRSDRSTRQGGFA